MKIFLEIEKKSLHYLTLFSKISKDVLRKVLWLVGQEVKTPPSHGGIRGSIPLQAATIYVK